jgi:hypothetical protein
MFLTAFRGTWRKSPSPRLLPERNHANQSLSDLQRQLPRSLHFYEQALQGKLEAMMTFGETPAAEHVPKEHHNLVIHTCLKVGDQMIMASDTTPTGQPAA